jgi:hypothetical protein
MRLKSKFRNYERLRRAHDSHIIQIAMKHGKRIFLLNIFELFLSSKVFIYHLNNVHHYYMMIHNMNH